MGQRLMTQSGYQHPAYAAAFAGLGRPVELPAAGGWVLERPVPGSPYRDAMGCYPLFACRDWSALRQDFAALGTRLVSLALVTDPFGEFDVEELQECFPDVCRPYKEHFVVDLSRPLESVLSSHHARNVRKAAARVEVEACAEPARWLETWRGLYDNLVRRHGIRGIATFPGDSFARQFEVPGLLVFRAVQGGETVGMLLWYRQGDVAYYHLGAYSDAGYELRSSFALFWSALGHLAAGGVRWACLGAGAGAHNDGSDGLTRFKQGWATGTRTTYFCGRVFDEKAFAEVVRAKGSAPTAYFPPYRQGEFS